MIQEIKYPIDWKYRVIGTQEEHIRNAIDEVLETKEYKLKFSNKSSKGKFISFEISLNIESEKERDSIFVNLKNHSKINMII